MWSFGIVLITGLTLLLTSGEELGEMGSPPGTGPHSVGSTFLLELDHSRQHQNGAARPVPVVVFYPVDADKTIGAIRTRNRSYWARNEPTRGRTRAPHRTGTTRHSRHPEG